MGEYVIIIVVCIKLFKEGKLKTKSNDTGYLREFMPDMWTGSNSSRN